MISLRHTHYDIVIAGGGMVGASLAVSLKNTGKKILLVEAVSYENEQQQSFDERTVALTYSSRLIFENLDIWAQINKLGATPIRNIHISDQGHFGMTHLHCDMVGTEALGYVVPTRHIGNCLWQEIQSDEQIEVACPAKIIHCDNQQDKAHLTIQDAQQNHIELSTDLIAIADGGRSNLSQQLNLGASETSYNSHAILCFITANKAHHGRAYERFTKEGPIALLPYKDNQYACVWTSHDDLLTQRMALSDRDYLRAIQQQFGYRAGRFIACTKRQAYPLARSELNAMATKHAVLIGNAAHKVHPVAGQGFNLGLRDVACLAQLLRQYWQSQSSSAKMNSQMNSQMNSHQNNTANTQIDNITSLIAQYRKERENEAKRVQWFTHGLIALFAQSNFVVKTMRGKLLNTIEMLPFVKRQLLKRTMGISQQHRKYYAKD